MIDPPSSQVVDVKTMTGESEFGKAYLSIRLRVSTMQGLTTEEPFNATARFFQPLYSGH